jgi:hypothetical protein
MSLKNDKHFNLSRKFEISYIILLYSVFPGLLFFLYLLSLFVKEKGLALVYGVVIFGDVTGILYSLGLLSGL